MGLLIKFARKRVAESRDRNLKTILAYVINSILKSKKKVLSIIH